MNTKAAALLLIESLSPQYKMLMTHQLEESCTAYLLATMLYRFQIELQEKKDTAPTPKHINTRRAYLKKNRNDFSY